ncbi:MAG: hypothetical protein JWO86_927 [Myxococcaceae bacterium]|nr:hypothetical protein [Myxococcaceae bacterium]
MGAVGAAGAHVASGTTTTAADVSSEAAPAPAAREGAQAAHVDDEGTPAPALPGQLVCRTKSAVDGTTEVFLEWTGSSAKGTLRRQAPSGMVYVQRVKAERADSLVIVDEPDNEDLMNHAAVIGKQDGKTLMRIGGAGQAWTACE